MTLAAEVLGTLLDYTRGDPCPMCHGEVNLRSDGVATSAECTACDWRREIPARWLYDKTLLEMSRRYSQAAWK